jgi:hypothetical protein
MMMPVRNDNSKTNPFRITLFLLLVASVIALHGCGGNSSNGDEGAVDESPDVIDISNAIFTESSRDCADYNNVYEASALDIARSLGFDADVSISNDDSSCTLASNGIPNHDFNDVTASFATHVAELNSTFNIPRNPSIAGSFSALDQRTYNAVMLNGVVLDILSAGCYDPNGPRADADGNVAIGCATEDDWLLDPLGTESKFGADQHNAHTQPDGRYHYHGSPEAMFDDNPGPDGSPVIGFAADGFPVYGSYFLDPDSGRVRKAVSGYSLKAGSRGTQSDDNPGGDYDGSYIDDWEYTGSGDLDECNGMMIDDLYAYYVTDSYPWVIGCFKGTPDTSFTKN